MADTFNYQKEFHAPRFFAVDSAVVIEIGDMVWLDVDDVKPAASFPWDTDLATTRANFAKKFVGISLDRSRAGDIVPIEVGTTGIYELACASATWELLDYVAPAQAAGTALENQKVAPIASQAAAIAQAAQREASAVAVVKIDLIPYSTRKIS